MTLIVISGLSHPGVFMRTLPEGPGFSTTEGHVDERFGLLALTKIHVRQINGCWQAFLDRSR